MDVSAYIEKDLQHSQVLLKNEPDCGYEYFWLNFKDSVNNAHLCDSLPTEVNHKLKNLAGKIHSITNKLNILQERREYNEIFITINNFLKQYFWLILAEGEYHCSIATTNLKRWIKLCEIRSVSPVPGFTPHNPLDDNNDFSPSSMRFILFLHKCCNNRDISIIIKSYVVDVIYGRLDSEDLFYNLFKESVLAKSNSIINKYLELYPEESVYMFKTYYNIDIPVGIKNAYKILKQIN